MTARRTAAAIFLLLLALSAGAIGLGGGWHADTAGDPDEPAHAVTSLMVRDFVAGAKWSDPGAFARAYYRDFPKIALGHYPPFYYLVAAAALLIWPDIATLLALQSLLLASLGLLIFFIGRRIAGAVSGVMAALLIVLLPLMLKLSLHVMADLLLVNLCLLAVLCWAWYAERPSVRRALLFGLVAASAILTKGSGLMLALVPPVGLLLRGEWKWLRSWSWWSAALPVVLLAGPWLFFTAGITKEGMTGQSALEFFASALPYYGGSLLRHLGYVWLALAFLGCLFWLRRAWKGSLGNVESALLASLAGGAAVVLLVPAGLSERYLAPLTPTFAILAVAGAQVLAGLLPGRARLWAVAGLIAVAWLPIAKLPRKTVTGYSAAVAQVQAAETPEAAQDVWLVSSDPRGEGGVIAEAAFRLEQRSPSPLRIYRAGKELASSDWMGRDYQAAFASESEVLAHLDKIGVRWIFVDLSVPPHARAAHEKLLEAAMRAAPERWALAFAQPVTRQPGITRDLLVYRSVVRTPGP